MNTLHTPLAPTQPDATDIAALRRHLHQHPELRFEEANTSALVANLLRDNGIAVQEGIGGYGVVGTLKKGRSQRAITLRADMDALPLHELNTFAHASKHRGKMHACGHDGHTAMLLGAASKLSKRIDFDGTVHFVFQPAEEGGAGALRMIEDGLFDRFPTDAIFGIHNWPGLPAGMFGVRPGPIMASSSSFTATLTGKGAHAAQPHRGTDPVIAAAQLALAWQTILTRNVDANHPAVLSITQIHTGTANNIIPETATMAGTVRTFDAATLDLIDDRMSAIAHATGEMFGLDVTFELERLYPATVNHEQETRRAVAAMASAVGPQNVDSLVTPSFASEDFSYFLQSTPGCYAFLGNGLLTSQAGADGLECSPELHSPHYDFNDSILDAGIAYWVALVKNYLPG